MVVNGRILSATGPSICLANGKAFFFEESQADKPHAKEDFDEDCTAYSLYRPEQP